MMSIENDYPIEKGFDSENDVMSFCNKYKEDLNVTFSVITKNGQWHLRIIGEDDQIIAFSNKLKGLGYIYFPASIHRLT